MTSESRQSDHRGVAERNFTCSVSGRSVPVAVWLPMSRQRSPLVLVGHGGSGHKRSDFVLDVVAPLVGEHGFAVAAIDGPVQINADANKALRSPAFLESLKQNAMVPIGGTPQQFAKFLAGDLERWTRVVKAGNIRPE
jgi:predicted dienelactone hydrolase